MSLILKKGTEETDPASYRPITLQNTDGKIITKMLVRRQSSIIHADQTEFIPAGSLFLTSGASSIISVTHSGTSGEANLSLDAHKALDHVEWPYTF